MTVAAVPRSGGVAGARLEWHPERLNAAVQAGFTKSLTAVLADANAGAWSKSGATLKVTSGGFGQAVELVPTGIGGIQEKGTRPHTIGPGKDGFLAFAGTGTFASGTVEHPGSRAEPYLWPAALRWANGGFQLSAHVTLASAGFA